MNARAKTIQIFLPHGDPRGIRVAEITTRIVQVIEVPRSLLEQFFAMPASKHVGVYFLFGGGDEAGEPRVYVGQTGDLRQRLASHNQKKEFWQRVLVLISRTGTLTQTHALFLEWHCLQAAIKAERYAVENGNAGSRPHTPAPLEADCMEMFETGQTLMSTLGYPIFDEIGAGASRGAEQIFVATSAGADGRGTYSVDGFVVFKGSSGRREVVPSMSGTSEERLRNRLLESGILRLEGDRVVMTRNHLFDSPSAAGAVLLGRKTNGWTTWKTPDGRTLNEVHRAGGQTDATDE